MSVGVMKELKTKAEESGRLLRLCFTRKKEKQNTLIIVY
jgi:hypothetical protein